MNALSLLGLATRSELEALKSEVADLKESLQISNQTAPKNSADGGIRFIQDLDAEPEPVQQILKKAMSSMVEDDSQLRKQA